jgi:hypothetical protein
MCQNIYTMCKLANYAALNTGLTRKEKLTRFTSTLMLKCIENVSAETSEKDYRTGKITLRWTLGK